MVGKFTLRRNTLGNLSALAFVGVSAQLYNDLHYGPRFDTAEFSQWNSCSDFEGLVHVGGLYEDETSHMLLRFSERSVGNRRFAMADSNGTRATHRLQRFGS
jgi:hypothetical protein